MNKQQLLTTAKRVIDQRRFDAEETAAARLEELRANTEWTTLERELRGAQVDFAMGKGNANELKNKIALCEEKQKRLLAELNIKESELVPHYSCPVCNDTGYVNGRRCKCLENELRKLIVADGNVYNAQFTFENNRETDKHNLAVYKKAREICINGNSNMLITGNVGAGKTYLLTACANLCAELSKSIFFVTAFSLGNTFLNVYTNATDARDIFATLTETDVLLIDDLGTEPVFNGVTAQLLFSLINERIVNKKQTFVTTNLSLNNIRERYDERIFSRLIDQNITFVAQLVGNDKRLEKSR